MLIVIIRKVWLLGRRAERVMAQRIYGGDVGRETGKTGSFSR
jgi:hypothetical protein